MARRGNTSAEQTMRDLVDKATAEVTQQVHGVQQIIPSFYGPELTLDVADKDGTWMRLAYVPQDDLETAGIGELA